jgi:twitching motility protein PilT
MAMFPPEEQAVVRLRLAESLHAVVSQRLLPRASGSGRVVAVEVMLVTAAIRDLIGEGRVGEIRDFIAEGRTQYGMQTFDQHLTDLVRRGEVAYEVALEAATRPSDFALQFKLLGPPSAAPAMAPAGTPAAAAAGGEPAGVGAAEETGLQQGGDFDFLHGG